MSNEDMELSSDERSAPVTVSSGRGVQIMGILNITPDSFFSGSRNMTVEGKVKVEEAVERAVGMVREGADYIDIGACSTRPGSESVSLEEEWRRLSAVLVPVREAIDKECGGTSAEAPCESGKASSRAIRISIDTFRSEIARRCFGEIGPITVNDISAGDDDPQMLSIVGANSLEYIAMHKRGTQTDMQTLCDYPDGVTAAVKAYFEDFATRAAEAGVRDWILDPGFGFAKTVEQNYELMDNLAEFKSFGRRILVGISRKSMIYKPLGLTPDDPRTLEETTRLHRRALSLGADILRVHDVAVAKSLLGDAK